jgi:hypothetical protein
VHACPSLRFVFAQVVVPVNTGKLTFQVSRQVGAACWLSRALACVNAECARAALQVPGGDVIVQIGYNDPILNGNPIAVLRQKAPPPLSVCLTRLRRFLTPA